MPGSSQLTLNAFCDRYRSLEGDLKDVLTWSFGDVWLLQQQVGDDIADFRENLEQADAGAPNS